MCSLTPSEKFPRPSNDFAERPRKSRMRGMATVTSRSRKSYILEPRSVTLAPIGMPSRTLKEATDFLARVTTAFCPAIRESSSWADLAFLESRTASAPHPMLSTILLSRGICMSLAYPNCSLSADRTLPS